MVEVKYWGFIFPLITIICLILSLFFPMMNVSIDYSPAFNIQDKLYLTGGGIIDALDSYIDTYDEIRIIRIYLMGMIIGFIISIVTTSILSIISAIFVISRINRLKIAKIMWLIMGVSLLTSQLFLLFYFNFLIRTRLSHEDIFIYPLDVRFTMGFAMIFLMIGGAVLLLGFILTSIVK
ncbi:MAG: hypothetical protein ACFE9T_13290 [Promethearchaeota archaeon]